MGSGGNGISLDLGIGSSIDPLHLTEVTSTSINSHRAIRGQESQCFFLTPRCCRVRGLCTWIERRLTLQLTSGCGGWESKDEIKVLFNWILFLAETYSSGFYIWPQWGISKWCNHYKVFNTKCTLRWSICPFSSFWQYPNSGTRTWQKWTLPSNSDLTNFKQMELTT